MSQPISHPNSPVLEVTLLTPTDAHEPSTRLLSELQTVRHLLAAKVAPTHSRFYRSLTSNGKPSGKRICILGFWPCLSDHSDFLADRELSREVLGAQEDVLRWVWTGHVGLNEPIERVRAKMAAAKVVQLSRWTVDVSKKGEFSEILQRQEKEKEGSEEPLKGFVFAEGWGVDGEQKSGVGLIEYLRLKGWENLECVEGVLSEYERCSQNVNLLVGEPQEHRVYQRFESDIYIDMED